MTDEMSPPVEVRLRDLESQKLGEALILWKESGYPESGHTINILRQCVINYTAAQKLVETKVQSMKISAELEAILARQRAHDKLGVRLGL